LVTAPSESGLVDYATAGLTVPGEQQSGDRYVVTATAEGTLVAVIDALGHGVEAAQTARVAVAALEQHATEAVTMLIQRCHEEMKATRGAVISLAFFHATNRAITWLGIGNVEGILLRVDPQASQENIVMRGGVVGFQLPVLQPLRISVAPGDTLIFATDGIRSGFEQGLCVSRPLQDIADTICSQHSKGNDDALVLVARYRGDSA
jgi:negative regulator of sigma-B (phosphoserine phosphatase)